MRTALTRVFGRTPSTFKNNRRGVRIGMEALESRDVPTALTWTDAVGNNDFYTAGNWVITGTQTVASNAPYAGDDVTFDGSVSSAPCDNLGTLQAPPPGGGGGLGGDGGGDGTIGGSSPTGLNSLSVINGYAGDVTVVAPLPIGTFLMDGDPSAIIDQPGGYGANDITVTGALNWLTGTINSTSNLANILLVGATAYIGPASAGAVTSGDNITLSNSASLTIDPGTVNLGNGAGVTVGSNCAMTVNAVTPGGQKATVTFTGAGKPWSESDTQINLNSGATVTVKGPGTWKTEQKIKNNGGVVEILGNATVAINLNTVNATPFFQSNGTLKLHSGSTLQTPGTVGVAIAGGSINIVADSPQGATTPAILKLDTNGTLLMMNSSLPTFSTPTQGWWPAGTQLYWTFEITGNVELEQATFAPRVDDSANGISDTIQIDGSLTIDNTYTLTIAPVSYNNVGTGLPVGFKRTFLTAATGITNNGTITVVATNPPYGVNIFQPLGNPNERDLILVPG